ncbi:MAG TPA: uroporphyrinogen-III C-methyltransferase [Candidatus Eisenbacteria bacterium]|nr:uroporphyrinogen-III C-methyltransferase [Candidatus Eisenbacteria bacterium]
MKGKVHLVGAGPGDPDLLTVKGLRLLQTADVVLHDDLVAPEVLRLIPPSANVHNVGKRCGKKTLQQEEINFLMIGFADSGRQVVRLKSGDPMIFGRAGEEIEALRRADVDYEVIPGVTSALGAASAAEIPLTHRRHSSAVVFITAHQADGSEAANWKKLAGSGATLVIYMPGRDYSDVAAKLKASGQVLDTPCAIVSRAGTAHQQAYRTTIGELAVAPALPAPSLLVVGEVVHFAASDVFQNLEFPTQHDRQSASLGSSAAQEPVE